MTLLWRLSNRVGWVLAMGLALVFWTGCGGSQQATRSPSESLSSNPVPTAMSVSPSSVVAGSSEFTLTVNGGNFISSSVVNWNGSSRATTFVSASQLTAAIAAADVASAGLAQVTVFTPSPGGGTSSAVTFSITAADNPVPTITSLSPSSATAGGAAFTLTINGNNFLSTSTVNWNGSPRTATFVSASQLIATIIAADIAASGTANITVINPAPGGGISPAANFTINPPQQTVGVVDNISVDPQGNSGDGVSFISVLSSDGRYVAFESGATTLVDHDTNGAEDVFLRDTCKGASAPSSCTPSTIRVSVDAAGNQLPSGGFAGGSEGAYLSGDGRFVLFPALVGEIIPNPPVPPNTVEYFLRDTCLGQDSSCSSTTTLASVDGSGNAAASNSMEGTISSNARVVVFQSNARNLVPGVTNGRLHIYAHDSCLGATACTPSTVLVSADSSGNEANAESDYPAMSADGRYVAFTSHATNLIANDTNNVVDVFLRDTCIGALVGCTPSTILVTANTSGGVSGGGLQQIAGLVSISGDGRYVLFNSNATDLVSINTNGVYQVYLRDTCIGASGSCTPQTTLVSTDDNGNAGMTDSLAKGQGLLSPAGRYLAYNSLIQEGLLPAVTYARDTCFGASANCMPRRVLLSVDTHLYNTTGQSFAAKAISADGRYVVLDDFGESNQVYLALTSF